MRPAPARALATSIGTAVLTLWAAGAAAAESTPAANFALGFSSSQPHTATRVGLHIFFKDPADPTAKPSPQRKIVIQLPAGARIDGAAVPACAADDPQLIAQGPAACQAGSKVGAGTLTLFTGGGPLFDPFIDDVKLFNGGRELIEVFNKQGSETTTATGRRTYTDARTLSESPLPQPGGPPNGESTVRSLDYRLDALRGPAGRAFITTPSTCPGSRRWTSRLTFVTADKHTYTARATTPCRVGAAQIRAAITPHRILSGRTLRFRVRVRSSQERCTQRALIRIGGASPARSDTHGRATVVARFVRRGGRRLTASHEGCRSGHVSVRVL